jgi:vacuolar-type H+-ATPase subunit H
MKESKAVSPVQAEQAIQTVLQAEQDAEAAIRDCENEARLIIQTAQADALKILTRTDQRITNVEMRHAHKLDQLIRNIENEGSAELKHDASQPIEQKTLQNIVEKLAAEICRTYASPEDVVETGQ